MEMTINNPLKRKEDQSLGSYTWILIFRIIGSVMFVAAVFKTVVTMFWIGKETVPMNRFEIGFAVVGFVLAWAGKNLGELANGIGKKIIDKFF
ncbi:MAG: hypothetical protein AAF634_11625 [Bacteroidota bacterium]